MKIYEHKIGEMCDDRQITVFLYNGAKLYFRLTLAVPDRTDHGRRAPRPPRRHAPRGARPACTPPAAAPASGAPARRSLSLELRKLLVRR